MKVKIENKWAEVTDEKMFLDTVFFRVASEDKGQVVLNWVPVQDVQAIQGRPVRLN